MNANTSGQDVASLGYWQRPAVERFLATSLSNADMAKRVLSGELDMIAFDFAPGNDKSKVPDDIAAELAMRLIGTVERAANGNLVFSTTPPDDKTKVWFQIDPTTSIPIGSAKTWNETAKAWLPITQSGSPYIPPQRRSGMIYAQAGASTANFDFPDMGTSDYIVTLTPTTFLNGSWGVAPNAFPTHFGWTVVNKANDQISVGFYGTPTGGLNFEVDLEERIKP